MNAGKKITELNEATAITDESSFIVEMGDGKTSCIYRQKNSLCLQQRCC